MSGKMDLEQSADVEENIHSHSESNLFDNVIGEIEDIIMDEGFRSLEREFVEHHCTLFDVDSEENRLEWMDVFSAYGQLVEGYLDAQLRQRLPEFAMDAFLAQIAGRQDELDGDIFDLLLSFTDFSHFKEMMFDYRRAKDGEMPCLDGVITTIQLPG